jgi:oxygen-independent coproporphyrinogen-3 oxidase
MARRLTGLLEQAGYRQLGLDHFARPDDSLATRQLSRNFQGYTTDRADALIGLGASAIGRFPQGYVQNAVSAADYARRVEQGNLGTVRGWALSQDDMLRAFVIERLMCDFEFSSQAVRDRFGPVAAELWHEVEAIVADAADGLIERTDDGFRLTKLGRPFVRSLCSSFDTYLNRTAIDTSRHSLSV